jgi:asparagine synthase (glutamine-hydrolysing)
MEALKRPILGKIGGTASTQRTRPIKEKQLCAYLILGGTPIMCSIMGYAGSTISMAKFKECFDRTISRGPDMSKVVATGKGILGFHRLAIMDLHESGMQPFSLDGDYLVCNGEIYGFRAIRTELAREYTFKSDSDCEVLLPMYRKYGLGMFAKLDAEFALIIYDSRKKSYLAARDPIGIRPLFYGYDQNGDMLFASEAKNLIGLTAKIMPFPPGHYYADGKFVCYCDPARVEAVCHDNLATICQNIYVKLITGIKKRLDADAPLGFLLSGGLDSSLVCAVSAKILGKPIRTFAIGMSTDAIDLKYAREVADYIKSDHTEVIITQTDVIKALPEVVSVLGTYDITTIRASIGMYLICKAIHETTDIRVLLTGEISDELFGYKYTDFAPSAKAFQKEAEKRIRELHMYDVLRADRCISANSIEARVPFGDLDFVKYVMSIDPEKKLNTYGKGKYLLRRAFAGDYLPHSILMREKAAFSDAVGHSMVNYLKEYAGAKYSEPEFEKRSKQYDFATPFTKESLLYRELFEQYYPGQAEMITDFWMPNKEWEGCNVNDPSARALSNYGASGK